MNPLKNFDDFLKERIVKKQFPDFSRADFLVGESEKSFLSVKEMVDKIGITENNANTIIKICYDIIMELIRAKMLRDGFSASGQGAHEAEVSYLRIIGFNENDIQFMDKLRFFRNRITYYGKILDKEYAEQVYSFLSEVIPKLKVSVKDIKK